MESDPIDLIQWNDYSRDFLRAFRANMELEDENLELGFQNPIDENVLLA